MPTCRPWLRRIPGLNLVLAAGLLLLSGADARAVLQSAGDVVTHTVEPAAIEVVLANGPRARLELLRDDLVHVRFAPAGTFADRPTGALAQYTPPAPTVDIVEEVDAITLTTARLRVRVGRTPFRVSVRRPDGSPLVVDEQTVGHAFDPDLGWVFALQEAPPGEAYLGLGQRGGSLDRRGRRFVLANTDSAGYDDDTDPLYFSIPFFYGLSAGRSYGVFLDNPSFPFFDFDSTGTGIRAFGAVAGELDYYVFDGPSPREVNSTYLDLTGRMPLPPIWSVGYHQARFGYDSQVKILEVAQGFRDRGIPLDAIHIDIDHMENLKLFTWDPVRFPNPTAMNQALRQIGVRSVVLIEPLMGTWDPKWPLFAGAGFLLRDPILSFPHVATIWFGEVSFVDFSNPAAAYWWGVLHRDFLSTGVSGVWNDLNEPAENAMPLEIEHDFDGKPRPHRDARNLYALQHTAMTRSVLQGLRPNERPFLFSRSGFAGIQRNAAMWSGDGNSTWEGFRTAIPLGLSMSVSGLPFFGHDVGGFLGSPPAELYARWIAAGAFTPFFRTHSVNIAQEREPWSFGPIVEVISREYIKLRERMLPYVYSAFEEASQSGLPVARPLVFDFPEDPATLAQRDSWIFGPSLLVAPVVEEGASQRSVYLPAGVDWIDFWTDERHAGGTTVVANAPLGVLPLYVRSGALVATGYDRDYAEQDLPRDLLFEVYPDGSSQAVVYEDDGLSLDYQRGVARKTLVQLVASPSELRFGVGGFGSFDPGPRVLTFRCHRTARPSSVLHDGQPLDELASPAEQASGAAGWFHDEASMRLSMRIVDAGVDTTVRVVFP